MRRKKFDKEAQSGDTDPKTHFLHQFQQLDIADYAENAEAGVKNLRLRPPHSDWAGGPQDRGENLRRLSRAASVDSSVSAASPAAGGPCLHDGLVLGGSRHRVRRPRQLQRPPALRPHPLAALQAGLGGATHLHRVLSTISR